MLQLDRRNSGIYVIQNIETNRVYIGSSIDISRRLKEHLRNLRGNKHCNAHLQSAWNKYGEKAFELDELDTCPVEALEYMETYWINMCNSANRLHGYNVNTTGFNSRRKTSEETKEKIRIKATGRKRSKEHNDKMSKILSGMKKPKQSETMKKLYKEGKIKKGVWPEGHFEKMRSRVTVKNAYQNASIYGGKDIYAIKENSNIVLHFPSASEASRQLGVQKRTILDFVKGITKTKKTQSGWIFSYQEKSANENCSILAR